MKKTLFLSIVLFFLCEAVFSQKMSDANTLTKFVEAPNSDIVLANMVSADILSVDKISSVGAMIWKKQFKLDKPMKNASQKFEVSTIALQENNIFLLVDSTLFKIDQNGILVKKKNLKYSFNKMVMDSTNLYLYNQVNYTKQNEFVEKINLNTLNTVWVKELPQNGISTGMMNDIQAKDNEFRILKHHIRKEDKHLIVKEFVFSQNANDNSFKIDSIDLGINQGMFKQPKTIKYSEAGNLMYYSYLLGKYFDFIEINKNGQVLNKIRITEPYPGIEPIPVYNPESCDFSIDKKSGDLLVDYRYCYWKDCYYAYHARVNKDGVVLERCISFVNVYKPNLTGLSVANDGQLLFLTGSALMKSKKYCENSIKTEEVLATSFQITPNPSSGIFNIKTDENVTISVFNTTGALILSKQISDGSEIDLGIIAAGVYFYQVQNIENQSIVRKGKLVKM